MLGWRFIMRGKWVVFLGSVLALLVIGNPVSAHHGLASYDTSKTTTLKGKIEEFDFINPHCELYVEAPDDNGKMVKWVGELTNPGALHRHGWTKEMFKPGDQITLIGNRAKNGAAVIRILKVVMADGRELDPFAGEG
jgi:hypothetical protein